MTFTLLVSKQPFAGATLLPSVVAGFAAAAPGVHAQASANPDDIIRFVLRPPAGTFF
jgi:hypothetical protein